MTSYCAKMTRYQVRLNCFWKAASFVYLRLKFIYFMKKVSFILFFFFSFASFSQTSNYWLQSDGGPNVDENMDITKDNSNNLISIGYFTNTMTFPAGTTLTSTGSGTSDVL